MEKRKRQPTHLYIPSRVTAFLESLEDSSKRPLILPHLYPAVDAAQYAEPATDFEVGTPIGRIGNLLIVEDDNIGNSYGTESNQSAMVVGRASDATFYSSVPMLKVQQDTSLTKELAVRVQMFMYGAVIHRYSEAWNWITGTSLDIAAPTI